MLQQASACKNYELTLSVQNIYVQKEGKLAFCQWILTMRDQYIGICGPTSCGSPAW